MKKAKSIGLIWISSLIFLLPFACENTSENLNEIRDVCYEAEILPIMQNSCATENCHDVSAAGGFRLDSYSDIILGVKSGDPSNSPVYKTIIARDENRMPPDQPLDIDSRMLIRLWIQQGAVRTVCDDSINPNDTIFEEPWSNPNACFDRDILPLMISSCGITGCHDPFTMEQEFNFTNYNGILKGVIPGNPTISKIYESISKVEPDDRMPPPPNNPLSQAQIDTIYNWILRGASDEACGELCDTIDVTYLNNLAAIIEISCHGCHSGLAPQAGIKLENYSDLLAVNNAGALPAVLRGANAYPLMPPFNPLSECQIRQFEIWNENGNPE